jgi:hypothetical protein
MRAVVWVSALQIGGAAVVPAPRAAGTAILERAAVFTAKVHERELTARVPPFSADSSGSFLEAPDGTRALVLRVRHEGARAVRLHIGGMRLPAGARLFVYGLSNGAAVDVAGPWETAGPSVYGSFWTPAVRGREAILELQADGDLPSDIPFEVLESAAADHPDAQEEPAGTGELRTSMYRGAALNHEVRDGVGIFEGDIVLGAAIELIAAGRKASGRSAVAITAAKYRWPDGVVPYVIDAAIPNVARLRAAIDHWNAKLAGVVQLVPRADEKNHVRFTRADSSGQCASHIGMVGFQQPVYVGDSCTTGNIIHEIGHTFGLWHEQSREDRDRFVKIVWANVRSGYGYNFEQNIRDGEDIGGYDYASIMHYSANAFSANGLPTIETIPAGVAIGQRDSLSTGDITAIAKLYAPSRSATATAPASVPVAVAVASNPAGLQIRVDGVLYTTAQTFNWTIGSIHTVEAVDTVSGTGTKYTFAGWSDLGARSHTVAAITAGASYTATFALNYPARITVFPVASAGVATVTPATADTYYAANTTVALTAAAAPGYCFSGWDELLTGTPARTTLTVTKPYSLRANFIEGGITVSPAESAAPAAGATLSLSVAATSGCMWEARSDASWITIDGGRTGTGPLTVTYTVAPNSTGAWRWGTIVVNGEVHTISQPSVEPLPDN